MSTIMRLISIVFIFNSVSFLFTGNLQMAAENLLIASMWVFGSALAS